MDLPLAICIFLGSNLVFWSCKKQSIVARSSEEEKYCALAYTTPELTTLRSLLSELRVSIKDPFPSLLWQCQCYLYCCQPSISCLHKTHWVDYHFIHDFISASVLNMQFVWIENHIVDSFTKGLTSSCFLLLHNKLVVHSLPLFCGGMFKWLLNLTCCLD